MIKINSILNKKRINKKRINKRINKFKKNKQKGGDVCSSAGPTGNFSTLIADISCLSTSFNKCFFCY